MEIGPCPQMREMMSSPESEAAEEEIEEETMETDPHGH